jgi:Rps23 Pro-64 3,4-dihydroxylase Tpa1-like proline 4-hydroxylase
MKLMKGPTIPQPQILVVDDWYSKEEEERVWKELEFYTQPNKFDRAENGNVALDEDNKVLGEHFRVHLDQLYTPKARDLLNISDILNYHSKLQTPQFHEAIKKANPTYYRMFRETNITYSLISYYDANDYYKPHHDIFMWTVLIWFYKQPKAYTGGDLIFPEYNNFRVESLHNRMIAFPSYYLHGVETINLPEDKTNKGLGRYTITHFLHTHAGGKYWENELIK